jgi:hypothetical protein
LPLDTGFSRNLTFGHALMNMPIKILRAGYSVREYCIFFLNKYLLVTGCFGSLPGGDNHSIKHSFHKLGDDFLPTTLGRLR